MYGYDTKSWRNSPENHQMKRERAAATAAFVPQPESVVVYPQCVCKAKEYPHDALYHHGQLWPREFVRTPRRPAQS